LIERYSEQFAQLRILQDKQAGKISCTLEGVKLDSSVDKEISWDTAVLQAIAKTLAPEFASELITTEMSISEKAFKAVSEPTLLAKLQAARIVKYKEPKIAINLE
jgi:hypothetical protein